MPTQPLDPQVITEAFAAVKEHGSVNAAAKHLGIPRTTLQDRLKHQIPKNASASTARCGRSLSDFRAEHDKDYIVPRKIEAALKQLGDLWEYEVAFAKLAGVSLADLANYREQYADYFCVVRSSGKRAWSGSKAAAAKMREMAR